MQPAVITSHFYSLTVTLTLLLILAFPLFLTSVAVAQNSVQVALTKHTLNVDAHPLTLWEKSAPNAEHAVLLVHGRTWSALPDFDLQVAGEELSLMNGLVEHGYAVYAIDLRGYGETPRDDSGWLTPNRAADDVAAALQWIAVKAGTKPHLFGWSMGSTVSQLSVQRHPNLAVSLTLFGYWRDVDGILAADGETLQPKYEPNTAQAAASDFIVPGSISAKAIDAYVSAALAADPVRTDVRHTDQYNALQEALIKIPTLVIAGEFDPLAPTEQQTKLYARIGSGHKQLVTVPGGDHAAFLEAPRDYFIHALVSFWQSVTPVLMQE